MMARNTNVSFKGRIQKRKTNHLQIITFSLQRAAGPYRSCHTKGDTLLWSLERHFGAAFTPKLKYAWSALCDAVQREMIRAARS